MEITQIVSKVCKYFNQDPESLKNKTRKREIVQTRQICMYFAKKYTKKSLAYIGETIGGKDHATVLHACKTVNNLYDTDCEYMGDIDALDAIVSKLADINQITPTKIMLRVRLSVSQYRNGRYLYTLNGKFKVSRLRTLFITVASIEQALKMVKLEEVDSLNLYLNYRKEPEIKAVNEMKEVVI